MAQTIKIGETTYGVRRQTYGAMLAQQSAVDDMQDAEDRLAAINQRIDHLGRRLQQLAEADGAIDDDAEAQLLEQRKQLRRQAAEVMAELFNAQMQVVHLRLEDGPPPERLMELLDVEQARAILGATDEVPPVPSGQDGESS